MGIFGKLRRSISGPSTAPDLSLLDQWQLPDVAPILKYEEAKEALGAAESTEEAIAVVQAYVRPKVEEKGQAGDPVAAITCLDRDFPERRDEIYLVSRAYGLFRGGRTSDGGGILGLGGGSIGV